MLVIAASWALPARADRVDDLCRTLTSDPSWRVRLQAAVVLGVQLVPVPDGSGALVQAIVPGGSARPIISSRSDSNSALSCLVVVVALGSVVVVVPTAITAVPGEPTSPGSLTATNAPLVPAWLSVEIAPVAPAALSKLWNGDVASEAPKETLVTSAFDAS